MGYAMLRHRGVANRVLYIVPRGVQASQAAEEYPKDLGAVSSQPAKSFIIGDTPIPALKAHRSGACEIFVTTIQALISSPSTVRTLCEMMATGKWFIVIDEYHHYGHTDNSWTKKVQSLPHQALLAMSATPHRKDEEKPFGPPDPVVSYVEARKLGYVKPLELQAYDYRVDAMVDNIDIQTFTTAEVYQAAGSTNPNEIDQWAATRELRWSPRYISPLLSRPIARMMSYNFRAQMLIQAISCSHAKMVCEQVKSLVGPEIKVDWVGTGPRGRMDADNIRILEEFCPRKDSRTGMRPWTLDILVNVQMASEGLDCMDVFEIVFLNAPSLNNTTLQTIGRASRVPIYLSECPTAIVSVDEACEMAKYLGSAVETCFDEIPVPGKERNGGGNGGDFPLPPDVVIKNAELINVRTDPHFGPLFDRAVKRAKEHPDTAAMTQEEIAQWVEDALREGIRKRDAVHNESAEIERLKKRIENGCRLKTFQVIGKLKKAGRLQIIEYQDMVKKIKNRKNRELRSYPDDASLSELKRHEEWLRRFELELKNGVPSWCL
jgi:hypothetical protein